MRKEGNNLIRKLLTNFTLQNKKSEIAASIQINSPKAHTKIILEEINLNFTKVLKEAALQARGTTYKENH